MRTFRRALFALLLCASACAQADTIGNSLDVRGLTDEQKAKLALEAAGMAKPQVPPAVDTAERWVNVGANVGKGLAGAAKEVGVVANDFVKTPVGKLTAFLIVWHIIGDKLIHVLGGLLFFATIIPLWMHVLRRFVLVQKITYTPVEGQKRLKKEVLYKDEGARTGDRMFAMTLWLAGALVVGCFITFTG